MKIYIVTEHEYQECHYDRTDIVGVFLSRESAKLFIDKEFGNPAFSSEANVWCINVKDYITLEEHEIIHE